MTEHERLALAEEQLERADANLREAIGNLGRIAGGSRWVGSMSWWKRMVKTHLRLQQIKREVHRWRVITKSEASSLSTRGLDDDN